jgi:hypothetical protein
MLRVVFRYVVTDRSMAGMYDHRVEWDRPLRPASGAARAASTRAA